MFQNSSQYILGCLHVQGSSCVIVSGIHCWLFLPEFSCVINSGCFDQHVFHVFCCGSHQQVAICYHIYKRNTITTKWSRKLCEGNISIWPYSHQYCSSGDIYSLILDIFQYRNSITFNELLTTDYNSVWFN
jgi:hypothetical protein